MATFLSRRPSEIGSFYHQPYLPPSVHTEYALSASSITNVPVLTEMCNMNDYSVYDFHSSLNLNEASQPQPQPPSPPGTYSLSAQPCSAPPSAGFSTSAPHGFAHSQLVSESGMIVVVGYTPSEGEANIPITVDVDLRPRESDEDTFGHGMSPVSLKLRLVLGRTALKTDVKRLQSMHRLNGAKVTEQDDVIRLRLYAYTPLHSETRFPEQFCVPVTIQAMDSETNVLESFTFGSFTYWAPNTVKPANTIDSAAYAELTPSSPLKRKREEDGDAQFAQSVPPLLANPRKALTVPARAETVLQLVRTTNLDAVSGDTDARVAVLEWVVGDKTLHPNSLDKRWSQSEFDAGRRLIRFRREQFDNKLLVSCEIISQEVYSEDDIVISCVYRRETRNCWFTSVDIIYLLERLIGNPFSVEEKNRIRRNLEGLKPTTVSKHKPGYEAFFQRIMDLPPPKPRNIEKDVKVFPWSVLSQALNKIISKYSVISSEATDSSPSQESSSPPSSGQDTCFAKASRSRSRSSGLLSLSEGPGLVKPSIAVPSQNSSESPQSLHSRIEFPSVMHTKTSSLISEPEQPASMTLLDQLSISRHASNSAFSGHWHRRSSINSIGTSSTDNCYADHMMHDVDVTPTQLYTSQLQSPFSKPGASNVSLANTADVDFAALSLDGNTSSTLIHSGNGAFGNMKADPGVSVFPEHGRHSTSSLSTDLIYPKVEEEQTSMHDALEAYRKSTLEQDVANDLLYGHFPSGNHCTAECATQRHGEVVVLGVRNIITDDSAKFFVKLIFSLFKTLTEQTVTVELKNDLSITGVLKSVDQFLNIRLDNIKVLDEARHPHMMAVKNCFIRGSVVRYVQLPAQHVDTQLLEDATRRESSNQVKR
ncbi:hypothetical protein EW145_g2901 [Phellinidium pouzarii]|uniref:Sm domain-containing protein n=1 Tax=Phellinidium pouzarii TaxID=167371 RepID=A0A4S4L919_9AGAM|nr:hypothetical protein EW145_g2901 [Phellinidium pouzarii]